MTETDVGDLAPAPAEVAPRRRFRWKAVVGLAGLGGLAIAALTTAREADGQNLPSAGAFAVALALQVTALAFAARSWVVLFPPTADRRALAASIYTSQLTKYLPAGGFVQVASQVALASEHGGVAAAALRLPVFSLNTVVAGATLCSILVLDGDLAGWARALAACGLLALGLLHRSVMAAALRLVRRIVPRVPDPADLPPQRSILASFGFALANMVAFSATFALLLGDLVNVDPITTAAAASAAWVIGYLIVFVPSGVGVREVVLLAALPHVATGTLLATSVAHRLLGLVSEAAMAGGSQVRAILARRGRTS